MSQSPSNPPPKKLPVLLLSVVTILLLVAFGWAGYILVKRFEQVEPDPLPVSQSNEVKAVDVAKVEKQLLSMKKRYRPGPHVSVMGLLPNGMIQQEVKGMKGSAGTPFVIPGAVFIPDDAPVPSLEPSRPKLTIHASTKQDRPLILIAGTPAKLKVNVRSLQGAVEGLLVRFDGYAGHFFLPSVIDSELGTIRIDGKGDSRFHFGMGAPVKPDGNLVDKDEPLELIMQVAAKNKDGTVSDYVGRKVKVLPLGTGDVEVTLSMDQTSDLDLYVVDPTGSAVFYRGKATDSGGHLDLDANAMCEDHLGVDHEHVFWEKGKAPPGTYQVRVSHYESCVAGEPVDYRITVRSCGETAVFSGQFVGMGRKKTCKADPKDDKLGCQKVVDFDVQPCEESLSPQ